MLDKEGNETTQGSEVTAKAEATAQAQTPTAEEQLKALQSKVEELTKDRERLDSGYKGLQKTVNQKDAELKKQANIDTRIEAINERIELLATAIASGKSTEEDMGNVPKEDRTKIIDQLKQMKQKEIADKQNAEMAKKGLEYKEKVEAAGLTDKDKAYWEIEDLISRGKFALADIQIRELEEKKKVAETKQPETQKKETDEEIFLRIAKQKGLLKTDNVIPAGGGQTEYGIRSDYISGKITSEQRDVKLRAIGVSPII